MNTAIKRVLIIEDNEDDYIIVRDLLDDITSETFVIEWVETVEAARAALNSQNYDVCLVDHRLGGRSGLALIQERVMGDPPFILLTGNEDHAVDIAATQAGAMDYLLKGHINAPLLERSIRYAIERASREAALEAALHKERLLAVAVTNLTDGMIVTDAQADDNPIIFANIALSTITGYTPEEILGRNCRFLQGPDTDPQMVTKIRTALREQREFRGAILNYRKDGTPFWNELKLTPVFDNEGQLTNYVGLQTDITARRRAQIALRESEARKAAILEAALDAIITIDHTKKILEFNPAAEKIFGYSRTQAIGRGIDELLTTALRPSGPQQTPVSELFRDNFLLGHQIELLGLRANGMEFPAELAITRIRVQEEPLFTAHVRDITDRKQAEESLRQSEANLRAAQQVAHLGSWELDLTHTEDIDRNSLRWSDEVFRIFGYEPGQIDATNEYFFKSVHPDDKYLVQSSMAQAIRKGQPYSLDHRIILPDGTERVVHEQAEVIYDLNGKPLRIVGTVQDITERKRSEEQTAASELRYRRLFEAANDGILILDATTGCVVDANPFLVKLLGYEIDELLGKKLWEIGLFGDVTANQEALATLQKTAEAQYENLALETQSGESIAVELVSNIYEVDGRKVIQCNIRDITKRKQAEAQLHFQKTLLEAQTEASLDGILVVSDEGKILSYNQRFLQMWQIPPQVIGASDAHLLKSIIGRVSDQREFLEKVKELYENRNEHSHEEVVLRNGSIFDRYSAPITSTQGDYYGRVWYFRDVTVAKQAQAGMARLAAIVESSSDAIIGKTLEGVTTSWNNGAEILYGYSAQEAIGQSAFRLLSPDFEEDEERKLLDKVARGERVADYEMVRVCKDGRHIEVSLTLSAVKNEKGEVVGASAISRDISDRKRAENALRSSEERFQSIVASVPGMVYQFILKPDGSMEWPFISEGCREVYEIDPHKFTEKPGWFLERIHEDDEYSFRSSVRLSAETLLPWSWVGRQQMESGKIKWIQCASRPRRLPDGSTLWNGLVMDITARKEAEEQRDRFFTMSIDMLGIAGFDGYFKRVNPAFTEILGFTETELLTQPFLDLVHPEDQANTQDIVKTLSQGHAVIGFENRYRTKTGAFRWFEWRAVAVPEDGLIYAAARDVTERKEANAELIRANDVLEERVATRTLELEQTNIALQIQIAEKEEAEAETRARGRQQEVVAELGQRALSNVELHTLLQGAISLSAAVLDVDFGLLLEWLPETQEAQVHAAIGQPHYPLQSRIPITPRSFTAYVVSSREPIIIHDTHIETRFEISAMMRAQKIRSVVAVAIQVGDQSSGAPAYGILALASPQVGAFGEEDENFLQSVSNILATAIDQRRIQQVALLARQEAERANYAKSEFLSRMSHELRTPLNAILGFGQILERQELSPLQQEGVGYILKGGHHLLALINEVLDIARVEAGKLELSLEPIGLVELVSECCALVRPLADQRGIQLVDLVPETQPYYVFADRQRLKQVVINLISNAIKYNRDGGKVEISVLQKHDEQLQLRVADSGFGMTQQDMKKLFTPFERLNAADLQIEGTGLGLVLSQRLVTGMGGTLGVESEVGTGSTFWVELPQTESPLETLSESLPVQAPEPLCSGERTYKVLSIEDNLSNTRVLEAILESRPEITLITAIQGSLGLDLAHQHRPDVILLDLHLPGLSGSEVLAQLRSSAATFDIPVIIISADATGTQIERLLGAGAIAYLTKPLDVDAFLGTLDEVLYSSEARATARQEKVER